jgi:DNA-binding NarL/FixJ family response regulator
MQSSNGQLLAQPDRPKPRVHNAKRCPLAIQQRIVNGLANGDSTRAIARALSVSVNTVSAIARQEWIQVETRKTRLAAQWEQAATKSVDQLK